MSTAGHDAFPHLVLELARRINDSHAEKKAHEFLEAVRALPGIDALSVLNFHANEYALSVDYTNRQERAMTRLRSLEDLGLSVAPIVVAIEKIGPDDSILLTRYSAFPGEKLARAESNPAPLEEAAKERVRRDMKALADRGLMHAYAGRGFAHWWMTSETHGLVLDHWSALRDAEPEDIREMMKQIERMFRDYEEG